MEQRNNKEFKENLRKRIYTFILDLVRFIDTLDKNDSLCKVALNQLLRCGTSIGANYIEAIAGSSKKDFTNFLSHSLKSCNETKFWLALLIDSDKTNLRQDDKLFTELVEISNILATSIRTLRGNNT